MSEGHANANAIDSSHEFNPCDSAMDKERNEENAVVVLGHQTSGDDDRIFFWDCAEGIAAEHGIPINELVLGTFLLTSRNIRVSD